MSLLLEAGGYTLGVGARPTFAAAVPLMVRNLFTKARLELQLDEASTDSMSERDEIALGTLIEIAADAGRPFTALLSAPDIRRAPFVTLVSYSERLDERPGAGACRVCGCTQDDCGLCTERTGQPCRWVEWPDRFACVTGLCSACAEVPR